MNIRQFKLANGDEIVTEVLEQDYNDNIEDQFTMIIKKPMKIDLQYDGYTRWYMLNPWMTYLHDEQDVIVFDESFIVAAANPSKEILNEYRKFCEYDEDLSSNKREKLEKEFVEMLQGLQGGDSSSSSGKILAFKRRKDESLH